MKALLAAVIGKSGYEKWKVNEPGVFYFPFSVQSRETPKKTGCWSCSQREREIDKTILNGPISVTDLFR